MSDQDIKYNEARKVLVSVGLAIGANATDIDKTEIASDFEAGLIDGDAAFNAFKKAGYAPETIIAYALSVRSKL
jgi:hypothetical protein